MGVYGEREDGLSLDAALYGIVAHGIGAAWIGTHEHDAVDVLMQQKGRADELAVHDPRDGVAELIALLERARLVCLVGKEHAGSLLAQGIFHHTAHERVVAHVGMRGKQDGERALCRGHLGYAAHELFLLARHRVVIVALRCDGRLVGSASLLASRAKARAGCRCA